MKPEAQPVPRQDSRQAKAAVGCDPHRKAAWLRHPCTVASPARTPSQARSVPNYQGWTLLAHWRGLDGLRRGWLWAWWTACRWVVVVSGDLPACVGDGAPLHNRAQQSLSHSGAPRLRRCAFCGRGLGLAAVKTRAAGMPRATCN